MKRSQAILWSSCLMVLSFFGTLVYAGCFDEGGWAGLQGSCFSHYGRYTSNGLDEDPVEHFEEGQTYTWTNVPTKYGFQIWGAWPLPEHWHYYNFANTSVTQVENGTTFLTEVIPSGDSSGGYWNIWEAYGANDANAGKLLYVQCYQAGVGFTIFDHETRNHALWKIVLWKPGDCNFDLEVDEDDEDILSANWNQSGKEWQHGDFNGDGTVNLTDLQIMATYWGT